jgi:hypothetical protein
MRSSGRRSMPRGTEEAIRRIEAIDREVEQILYVFPDLRRARRRAQVMPPRDGAAPRYSGRPYQLRGVRVH